MGKAGRPEEIERLSLWHQVTNLCSNTPTRGVRGAPFSSMAIGFSEGAYWWVPAQGGAEFSFVLKIETDSLDPTLILVLVLYDLRTKQMFTFDDRPVSQAPISMGAEIASLADASTVPTR
jgi:hypothetical protein